MTAVTGDAQLVRGASGLLGAFNRSGVLAAADVHVATRLGRLGDERSEPVLLAAALAVRSARLGSVCLDLAEVEATTAIEAESTHELAWPEPSAWLAALEASDLVAGADGDGDAARPLRLVDGVLYLDRYWRDEQVVASAVDAAITRTEPVIDTERMSAALTRLFGAEHADRQRLAAVVAATKWFSVIAGGPGTGKTTTVARLVALLRDQPEPTLRIALAAPTGRAAARLGEAVASAAETLEPTDRERIGTTEAFTLHRLLGWKPGSRTRFRHDATNPLPYDVVIVDEASMVSLTMMARLVEALRDDARLVLVGDPDQLSSVEVGAVLGDLVRRGAPVEGSSTLEQLAGTDLAALAPDERQFARDSGVVRLSHVYRFSGEIEQLAQGVRAGDVDAVLAVLDDAEAVELVESGSGALRADVLSAGHEIVRSARAGDGDAAVEALARHRLLCAHREGRHGVGRWSAQAQEWLRAEIEGYGHEGFWYIGRPLLVTANDYQLRLFNGDTGVVVDVDGEPRAAFRRDGKAETLPTSRLGEVQTMHAMSVHRSQGSQFERVTLVLPPADSALLTRELLYTAVTRASEHVRIIGTRDALAQAVARPIVRASGLRTRRS